MADSQEQSIGALWSKQSKGGANYFSGSIEIEGKKTQIVVFKNQFKKEEKHPDWKIFVSVPQGQQNKPEPEKQENAEPETASQGVDDDLPF